MPELSKATYLWCEQNQKFETKITGSKGDTHLVTYNRGNRGRYAYNWHCDCKGFAFRGYCSHVEAARKIKCEHGVEAACGSPAHNWVEENGRRVCPVCGSDAVPITIMV